jgi:hypothetical protein
MRANHSTIRWSRGRHRKLPTRPLARGTLALLAVTLALVSVAVPARGHVTNSFAHLWNDHILPLIRATDRGVNEASDPINWTKLRNVPDGFADGFDNGLSQV